MMLIRYIFFMLPFLVIFKMNPYNVSNISNNGKLCADVFLKTVKGDQLRINPGQLPLIFIPHKNLPKKWYPVIQEAMNELNSEAKREIFYLDTTGVTFDKEDLDGYNVIYVAFKPYSNTEQAMARNYFRGNIIDSATIKINSFAFDFYVDNEDGNHKKRIHLKTLMKHELMHVMGFKHNNDNPGSIMYSYLDYGEKKSELTEVEKDAILCMYGK